MIVKSLDNYRTWEELTPRPLDFTSYETWEEYPWSWYMGEREIEFGDTHGHEEMVFSGGEEHERCLNCGTWTQWWSVLWNGAGFCTPACRRQFDFQVFIDLAPWHEGAD